MITIRTENIRKEYAGHRALNDVSVQIPAGSVFGLLGPNGAGKTSLIRIINQIIAPDSGTVFFNNKAATASDTKFIGYLPEERGLYKKMKIGEQALYLAQLKGMSHSDAETNLKEWFDRFEIGGWWNKRVDELSKGMQQKVQFIVTVLHKPTLLILDEPFSGFDPINAQLIKNEILRLRNEGTTIVLSTHNMASVEELCDSIALIYKSNKILDGAVSEIRNKNKTNRYRITFTGTFDKLVASLATDYQIIEHTQSAAQSTIVLQLLNTDVSTNRLLTHLMQMGLISGFSEEVPNMNDIFLNAVAQANQQQ